MLLLVLPEKAFKAIVPVFIAIALVLIVLQPRLAAHLAARRGEPRRARRRAVAARDLPHRDLRRLLRRRAGDHAARVLGVALPEPLQRVNGLKNVLAGLVNLIAGVVFVFRAPVAWAPALLIAAGAMVGGVLGARYGRRLSPVALRGLDRRGGRWSRSPNSCSDGASAAILRRAMATCLVTGGAGSSGRICATSCCARGHRVICVDNFETGSLANIAAHPRAGVRASCTRTSSSRSSSTSRSTSSTTSPRPASPIDYLRLPLHTLKVGSYGTHHALGLAKQHRARFLTASTSEVYGDPQVHPQPESYWGHVNPIGPRGVYDEAKRYAEALTMAYHRQQGVDTAIVRIFNTYGPRMRPHDGRAIPTFLRQALQDRPITVFGDGVADALVLLRLAT